MKKGVLSFLIGAALAVLAYRYYISKKASVSASSGGGSSQDATFQNQDISVVDELLTNDTQDLVMVGNIPYSIAEPNVAIINAVYMGGPIELQAGWLLHEKTAVKGYVADNSTFIITRVQEFLNQPVKAAVALTDVEIY